MKIMTRWSHKLDTVGITEAIIYNEHPPLTSKTGCERLLSDREAFTISNGDEFLCGLTLSLNVANLIMII